VGRTVVKLLSPSSRLVVAAVVFAFVVLTVVGAIRPQAPGTAGLESAAGTSPPVAAATSPALDGPATAALPSAGPTASSATHAPGIVTPKPTVRATPKPTTKPSACKPTDQNKYVYNPSRLAVQAACIHVSGTVEAVRHEADGDLHILLALDPAYTRLLTPANQGEELGDLVVEPVCVRSVSQADAKGTCASDPDPFPGPFPVVGEAVWMEGRYVFDLDHGGWAELHPLFRWGDK
jgi:hypothetical protein